MEEERGAPAVGEFALAVDCGVVGGNEREAVISELRPTGLPVRGKLERKVSRTRATRRRSAAMFVAGELRASARVETSRGEVSIFDFGF